MHPRALIRLALATSICFAFACDDKKDANETNAKAKTGADTKTGPDEPKGGEPSAFFSDELDDLLGAAGALATILGYRMLRWGGVAAAGLAGVGIGLGIGGLAG